MIFLGVRAVGLLVLGWLSEVNGDRLLTRLSVWDGQWLLAIARSGYNGVPNGLVDAFGNRDPTTPLAFFPGYPAVVAVLRFTTGVDVELAGLAVSLVAGVVLAYGLARLGEMVPGGSRSAGLLLVALVAAAPMGVVWSMTYSEGLFCAFAVWALVGVLRRNWVVAGCCTALAGTVRPTGLALLIAVGLAALVAVAHREDGWRPWVGGLVAPAGLFGYLAFVATRTGTLGGWFALQERGWNSRFDGGTATLGFTEEVLASGRSVLEVGTVAVLAGALVLLVICWAQRLPWPLVVYAAGVLAMTIASNGLMNSKMRLALPAITLLVPVALALAKRRPSTVLAVVVAATLASAWFGGYAITGWSYAI
ncbi:MAG: hypothetical protein J2P20_04190 [Pseudonocardia sp.]|nr:hypothetical protein [Pseudonocardia sp.]MBO0876635.1 hypothetical protein [Pseudonocardia sp.]